MDNLSLPENPTPEQLTSVCLYLKDHSDLYVDLTANGPFITGMGVSYMFSNGAKWSNEMRNTGPFLILDEENYEAVFTALGLELPKAPTVN